MMNAVQVSTITPNPHWAKLPLFDRKGWEKLPFGDIADCISERADPKEEADAVYVGLEHLDPQDLHIRRWGKGSDVEGVKLRFYKGDIIFGRRRAYQRKLAVAEVDGICSAHAMVLRAKPGKCLPEFLPFLMMSDAFMQRAVEISVGSLSPTISWKVLKLQEFSLPPLEKQRRMAELLWAVDEVFGVHEELLEATKGKIASELSTFLHESDPWPSHKCGDILVDGPRNGYSPRIGADGEGLPTLSISCINDGRVVFDGNLKYAPVTAEEVESFFLQENDILVVRGNGNKTLCGRAGLVQEPVDQCFYPDLLIRLRFRPDILLPEFAVAMWNEPRTFRSLIRRAKSSNGIWKINGKDIRMHKLTVPPLAAQQEFMERAEGWRRLISRIDSKIASDMALRSSMINRAVA